jgi:dynein heavy chain
MTFRDQLKHKKQQQNMPIYDTLFKKMDDFTRTMNLLPELRDESMRERHWDSLRLEVKEEFDEKGDDFTLEEIFKLNFLEFETEILTLAEEAQKQLKVEKDLDEIVRVWTADSISDLYIESARSRATGEPFHKVASTENIM